MKKVLICFLVILMVIHPIFIGSTQVKAKTLGDLKDELQQKEEELQANKDKQAQTEQEISNVNASIKSIEAQISQTYIDIENLTNEITSLNAKIEQKEQEVKDIISFLQISNGESVYLEYMFGAKDFTDFIYRVAVSEQLASYNDKLITEYNGMIEANKQKQKEIEEKRVSLGEQQQQLEAKKRQLGQELTTLSDTGIDIEDEIEYQKEIITMYIDKGCEDNDNIATCGRSTLPKGTAFYRPIMSGYVTSEWGYRDLLGRSWHEGIDMSTGADAVAVYAVGNGMVAAILPRSSCGGNMVIVHHNINGQTYTTVYAHLKTIMVSKGQTVDRNTQVGTMGGGSDTWSYDKCSTGKHLHLTVATGLYGVDYNFTQMNYTYSINPRSVINLPSGLRNPWSDRITAF